MLTFWFYFWFRQEPKKSHCAPVRLFVSNLSRALNLHLSSSNLQAISQQSVNSQSAVSQPSVSHQSAVSQLPVSHQSVVSHSVCEINFRHPHNSKPSKHYQQNHQSPKRPFVDVEFVAGSFEGSPSALVRLSVVYRKRNRKDLPHL